MKSKTIIAIRMDTKQATRIQTSLLNNAEKKVLIWMAERQPKWVTSDFLSGIGFFGALVIAAGYVLSNININFFWLSSLGFVINWYGDSLDGTLARVRKCQRPVYGYYLDHTLDTVNESLMCIGAGLSPFVHLNIALAILIVYLLLTINVSVDAHLKGEFRLTYLKLGPTEFRLIVILVNTAMIFIHPLREFSRQVNFLGDTATFAALDYVGLAIFGILLIIHIVNVCFDLKGYAKIDPPHKLK